MISAHIQYAPMYHAAIKKQFNLMNGQSADGGPVSAHVQHLAAKELAEQTKMPEDNTIELKIGISEESKTVQERLTEQLSRSVDLQMARLNAGELIGDIQKIGISVDNEIVDVEEIKDLDG